MNKRAIITSALPYANGEIHLGHVASTYLPADVTTRFLKQNGVEAYYVCSSNSSHLIQLAYFEYNVGISYPKLSKDDILVFKNCSIICIMQYSRKIFVIVKYFLIFTIFLFH